MELLESLRSLLRRLLQRKRHIKIELCVGLSVLRLFHVSHIIRNRRIALFFVWHESGFYVKAENEKLIAADFVKKCTKKRAARTARLFFLIQPIKEAR